MKIFLSALLVHIFIYAAEPPFKPGEILKYTADWNGIKVGEAELFISGIEKVNGFDSYKISFTTKTKGLANRIFPIKKRYLKNLVSYIISQHFSLRNIRSFH